MFRNRISLGDAIVGELSKLPGKVIAKNLGGGQRGEKRFIKYPYFPKGNAKSLMISNISPKSKCKISYDLQHIPQCDIMKGPFLLQNFGKLHSRMFYVAFKETSLAIYKGSFKNLLKLTFNEYEWTN